MSLSLPIVSVSPAMRAAMASLSEASLSRAGVLFHGEAGSGRQLLAREMHRLGNPGGPFVVVDCSDGWLDELEMALFGNAKTTSSNGRGNGAGHPERVEESCGLLTARGGTLFLAHLADMPERVQARLARVLRDGEVLVGAGEAPERLAIRTTASGGPGWEDAVGEGRIRHDLFKRTAAFRVNVPALRQRREDIPRLAGGLLADECRARALAPKAIDGPALTLLAALPWKENVRELKALVATLASRGLGDRVSLDDVLECVKLDGGAPPLAMTGTLREARHRFEREYVSAVLERHKGRVAEAARALGIQRTNLYRKLRELRLRGRQ